MKPLKHTVILLLLFLLTVGCSQGIKHEISHYTKPLRGSDYGSLKAKKAEQDKQLNALNSQDLSSNLQGSANHVPHQIHSANYSSQLSQHVDSINGVADARVFTADGHAYVALVLDNSGQGFLKSQESGELVSGTRGAAATSTTSQPSIHNNPFRFFITVNDNSQLSERFIHTVTDSIMEFEPSITEVHISANKEFMYHMDEFAQLIWGGGSVETYAEQFNTLINHQFFGGHDMPTSLKQIRGTD